MDDRRYSDIVHNKIDEDGFRGGININTTNIVSTSSLGRASFGFPQIPQTQQSNVEVFRKTLDKFCLKENSNVKHSKFLPLSSFDTEKTHLNNLVAPF